jgi:hypothetical protein
MLAVSSAYAGQMMDSFGTPKKAPHWMNNTPLAPPDRVPENVSIDFDFDLGRKTYYHDERHRLRYGRDDGDSR